MINLMDLGYSLNEILREKRHSISLNRIGVEVTFTLRREQSERKSMAEEAAGEGGGAETEPSPLRFGGSESGESSAMQ